MTILVAPNWTNVANNTRAASVDQPTLAALPGLQQTYWDIHSGNWAQIETDPVKGKMLHFRMAANGGNRTEQVLNTPSFGIGSTCWVGFDFKCSTFAASQWNIAFQFKNDGTGSPPFSFQANSGESGPGTLRAYAASGLQNYLLSSTPTTWHRIVMGFTPAARAPNAVVEVWVDGGMVFRDTDWRSRNGSSDAPAMNGGTIYDQRTSAYLKFGIYGPAVSSVKDHYFANMVVATTRAEVMGGTTPTAPRDAATPTVASVGDGTVTLNLGATTGTISGDTRWLYRADSTQTTGEAFSPFTTVSSSIPLSTTTYQDTGLVNGRTYYWRQAVGQAGNVGSFGGPSEYVAATPGVLAFLEATNPPTQTATAGGSNPADTTFTVTNVGSAAGNAGFTVSDNATWLSLSVAGSSSGTTARTFDRVDDRIVMSLNSLPSGEPKTFFALVRKSTDVDMAPIGMSATTTTQHFLKSGDNADWAVSYQDASVGGVGLDSATHQTPLNSWVLLVASKSSATPGAIIGSMYDFATSTWYHGSGTANRTAFTSTDLVIGNQHTGTGTFLFGGEIAVCGAVPIVVSQTNRELMVSSGLITLATLAAAGFTSGNGAKVFPLDQASTATAVTDAVGGSTQTAITGTTVYTGTVPFVRTAGGGGTSGTALTTGTIVTQSYNITGLTAGTYPATVTIDPSETGLDNITKTSTLVVNPSGGGGTSIRDFDGVDDQIVTSLGNNDLTGAWTMICGVRRDADAVWGPLMVIENAAATGAQVGLYIGDTNPARPGVIWGASLSNSLANVSATNVQASDGWVIVAFTKASGSTAPRGHVFKGGAWTHANLGSTFADQPSASGGRIRFGSYLGTDFHNGKIGFAYIYKTALSDATFDTLDGGTKSTYLALGPSGGWEFNQASTGTAITDLTGGGANQTSITGTSAVTTDFPASSLYVFADPEVSGVPAAPQNLAVSNVTSGGAADLTWSASAGPSLHATNPYVIESSADLATWGTLTTSNTTSKTVTGLTVGSTTYLRVRAQNTNSQLSDVTLAVPAYVEAKPVAALTALTGVTATVGPGTITLAWNPSAANQGVIGYRIYVRTAGAGSFPATPSFDGAGELLASGKLSATVVLDPGSYDVTVRSYR